MKMTDFENGDIVPPLELCIEALKDERPSERCAAAAFCEMHALKMLSGTNRVTNDKYWEIYELLENMKDDPSNGVQGTIRDILWYREYIKAPRSR